MSLAQAKVGQPDLRTRMLSEGDPDARAAFTQIREHLGHAVMMQTTTGGKVPVAINPTTKKLQAYIEGEWQDIGG